MKVYQFEMWKKKFAVDIGSGNFFELDNAASEAISLLHRYSEEEAGCILSKKYGNKIASKTIGGLSNLKKKRVLFSKGKVKTPAIKTQITDLTLNIVNGCNLSCRYCWNSRGNYGNSPRNNKKMDYRVAHRAVDLLIKESAKAKDLVIDFYGGEPLLNFEAIRKTIEYCKGIRERRNINFRFLLATNGTLLQKERSEFLIENNVDIAVSLDGSPDVQNTQRPFADGTGSYEVVINNINSLSKDYRERLVGRATFTPYYADVIKTFKFLRNLGFGRIEVCESEKAGYGLDSRSRFFFSDKKGLEHLKSVYNKLALFYTREVIKGNLTYDNTYFNRFFKQLSRLYHIQSIIGTCSAGYSLMAVDIDGSIYPCTAFVGIPKFGVGSVTTGINETKLKAFLDTKICSNQACNECWVKRICMGCGSCYNLNYFANKTLGKPDNYYCELFRYKTELMIAMISEISQKNPRALDKVFVPEYYVTRGRINNNGD